jgi:hypothetical protein
VSGALSTGGVGALAIQIFRSKKNDSRNRRNDDGYSNERRFDQAENITPDFNRQDRDA